MSLAQAIPSVKSFGQRTWGWSLLAGMRGRQEHQLAGQYLLLPPQEILEHKIPKYLGMVQTDFSLHRDPRKRYLSLGWWGPLEVIRGMKEEEVEKES